MFLLGTYQFSQLTIKMQIKINAHCAYILMGILTWDGELNLDIM